MEIKIITKNLLLILILTLCEVIPCSPKISDKRLCYDPECSVPVSEAKSLVNYHSNDRKILSFPMNIDVKVFSKEAGKRRDLWGVEIDGVRGYAPRSMLREKRVFHRELKHEVPTEYVAPENISKDHENDEKSSPQVPTIIDAKSGIVTPIPPVSPSFEVIDGTTIDYSSDNQSPDDESYATKIRYSSSMEQPILSVHPNVASSELTINDDKLGGTDGLDGEADAVDDKKNESNNVDVNEVKDEEIKVEDKKIDEKSEKEIIEEVSPPSNVIEEPIKSEIVGDSAETIVEEKNEEIDGNSKIPSTEEEPKEEAGVLSSAYQTVTSLFDSLTTPSPATVDESVGEVKIEEAIPEEPILPEIVDEIGESSTVLPDSTGTREENVAHSTEATSVIVEEELKEVEADVEEESKEVEGKVEEMKEVEPVVPEEFMKIGGKVEGNETKIVDVNEDDRIIEKSGQPGVYEDDGLSGSAKHIVNNILNFNEFPGNRNLLNVESGRQFNEKIAVINEDPTPTPVDPPPKFVDPPPPIEEPPPIPPTESPLPVETEIQTKSAVPPEEASKTEDPTVLDQIDAPEVKIIDEPSSTSDQIAAPEVKIIEEPPSTSAPVEVTKNDIEVKVQTAQFCEADSDCSDSKPKNKIAEEGKGEEDEDEGFYDTAMMDVIYFGKNYWGTLSYAALTAFTTLLFSLGYYYIENRRRDGQFIAKINKLEKELLVATKECTALDEILKSTKNKLTSIEDESFGSNEMVASLKADLENANKSKAELEDQVASLEKDLEGATEAGLELERMLREILASNSAENPLAKSVEDLQTRLNAQQTANESLTNALQLKTQENETLSRDLAIMTQKCEQLEVEVTRITGELKEERELRRSNEGKLSGKVEELEKQLRDISAERINLRTQLRGKEMEMKDLLELVKQDNKNNIDYDKLADISHVKAEASQLAEERDELRIKLSEVEGAHQLLEEHMKVINEEVVSLSEQAKLAEKEKKEAETRLEVLSNFFKEKEAERQKEEALWLQQQGEVSTTVERLQTMHNEILSYKQQIESLKREILDQEKEYKTQITSLEAKAHEQWVLARQNERRLEEAKAEAGQLRNRLTMVEKNFSDTESDVKIHRMETNGETTTSPLFLGAEASSSPIMFSNTSGPPPPPPSYLYGPPLPPYMPPPLPPPGLPPYDVSQRPPPLGGRLASPPPMPPIPQNSGRYDNPGSPPPLSPPLIYGHRNYPPNPYGNERIPPPLPPWSGNDDLLSSSRNTGFHPFHRDQQRTRDHKGSLHSSGESLDKSHHSGKV